MTTSSLSLGPVVNIRTEASVAEVPSGSALQVLRRLGSIFTLVYAAKLKHVVSLLKGSQLNVAPVLEVENFTNEKKRFLFHIIGIEPQFENIIKNAPFIPITVGQRKPENQWTRDERKVANLDQRLKRLIMSILPDDQMNSVINCLTTKLTWDDLILYHEGPSNVKENYELASLFGKLKYEENLIDNIYETEKNKYLVSATPLSTAFFSSSIVQDFQDSPDDEEDTRSSQEYLNDLKEEYQSRALLAKSKRFFNKGTQRFSSTKATDQTECHKCGKKGHFARDCWSKTLVSTYQSPFQSKPFISPQHKPELRPTKDFEAKYNKVKAKLALLSSSASASKAPMVKNKCLIAEAYEWDEEEVSSDDNEMVEVKVLMALAEENDVVGKESARNGEWVKISMRKVHTLLEMEDNDDRKVCLDYLCIDLNYVEEQRSNLLSKHRNLVHELNTCKEQLLVLKQAKLDFLTMQHCTVKQIPSQRRNSGSDQLTEDPFQFRQKTSLCKNLQLMTQSGQLPGVDRDPAESQRNITDPSVAFIDSSTTDYDSPDESSVCSTPLPPLKKLEGVEPIYGPKTIKSILKSKSTLKAKALKGVIINEPFSAPAKGNKSSSASKVHSTHAGKLKSVKIEDDPSLAIVKKELNSLKIQVKKNQSSYPRSNQSQQIPQNALQNKYKT
ncbi:retrovirus-related pol polyprotein from transposon TNT 1-94 [Tanacetum coccineum]